MLVFVFQGRHKRNATFPGGQTTILQVTPTIRSECNNFFFFLLMTFVRITLATHSRYEVINTSSIVLLNDY